MRNPLDLYETDARVTYAALQQFWPQLQPYAHEGTTVLECCAGPGAMSSVLRQTFGNVITNDVDEQHSADFHLDMTKARSWSHICRQHRVDIVFSNPPFNLAHLILPHALSRARIAVVFLLRLSFMEPCQRGNKRDLLLQANPPSVQAPLNPRPQYSLNKHGKPGSDNVTSAWFVWSQVMQFPQPFQFITNWKDRSVPDYVTEQQARIEERIRGTL